ncbi:hypothetical protein [Nitrobacter sp. TKz-YC01]|uniref:hypothetical protein n=1 Tax=Nitrobacter sp. TKz-YC01 TaxID=3398703 RepID=UPI003A0FB9CF
MKRIDVVDPGTLCVLCQIKAIGEHVADPAVGFTIDDISSRRRPLMLMADRMKSSNHSTISTSLMRRTGFTILF